ncbi:MAG TPA: hypothetical protein VFX41_11220 [Actinomycetales bacterium]|nr:hypothetical protein [Actinomycetales bacterium]
MRAKPRSARVAVAIRTATGTFALLLASCSAHAADPLESYTDRGDACQQAISAISYADDALKPLGQEHFQDFNEEVRSKIAAVAGTLALEAHDLPSAEIRRKADAVQALAERAKSPDPSSGRERALLEYRGEAAKLVLMCEDATAKQ